MVRRQCNRYKTEPFGSDREDVLKRAKRFFRDHGAFMLTEYGNTYSAFSIPAFGSIPSGAVVYRFRGGKWEVMGNAE